MPSSACEKKRTALADGPGRIAGPLERATAPSEAARRPPRPDYPSADLSQKRLKRRRVLGARIDEYKQAPEWHMHCEGERGPPPVVCPPHPESVHKLQRGLRLEENARACGLDDLVVLTGHCRACELLFFKAYGSRREPPFSPPRPLAE